MKKLLTVFTIICIIATFLCVPAFAVVTESSGDGYALYNGSQFPDIDTIWTDKTTYPYSVVLFDRNSNVYELYVCGNEPYLHLVDFYLTITAESAVGYQLSNNTWEETFRGNLGVWVGVGSSTLQDIVWSNVDIVNTDDNAVSHSASIPIPLDGMQVITWDGDTSDLSAVGNKYTVADYANASNALAVMTTDGAFTASTNFGNSDGVWTVAGADGTTGYAFANPSEGIGAFKYSDNQYTSLIAYREGETPPEESQPPSGGEGETTGGITSAELEASQAAQTAEIVAKVESESNIIQAAISSLEAALNNSDILNYLKQTLSFRDFDLETGSLSTTTQTFEGIVPLFGHWAQNTENYLGRIVSTLANEKEEEVVKKTTGFWDLLISLFTSGDDGKAKADSDDMSQIVEFSDDVSDMISGGGQLSDFVTIFSSESTWSLFSDEASSSLDSVPRTYSFRSPRYYHRADSIYSDFYSQVLGREMGD